MSTRAWRGSPSGQALPARVTQRRSPPRLHPAGRGCAGDAPRSHAALDGGWRGSTATLALVAGAARQVGRNALLGACAIASALSSGCRQGGNWRSTHSSHGHSSVVSLELFWMTGNLTCIAATRDQRCHPENRGLTPPFIVFQAHSSGRGVPRLEGARPLSWGQHTLGAASKYPDPGQQGNDLSESQGDRIWSGAGFFPRGFPNPPTTCLTFSLWRDLSVWRIWGGYFGRRRSGWGGVY